MNLKFNTGDTVKIVRDNEVWNGSVAKVASLTNDPEYPYILRFISSNRPNTVGEEFTWDEVSLDRFDDKRDMLDRIIEANFPRRMDVFYSNTTGGAVVMGDTGKLYRITSDGAIESE